ncbi:MAG: hypothetical protein U5L04_14300 [Trueperaceae bacterium]|nr:hypothetical protein [Trueperaceae bacterium]
MFRYLLVLMISLLAPISVGVAQALSEGSELLITDPSSEVILGYGVVAAGRLELELVRESSAVVLLFIQPDGAFVVQAGSLATDGQITLMRDDGTVFGLAELLQERSLGLELSYTPEESFEGDNTDDEVLGPPTERGRPADNPGLGRENAPGQGGDNPGRGGGRDDNPGRGDDNPGQGGGRDDNPGQGGGSDDNPGQGGGRDDDNPGQGGGRDDNPGRGDDNPGQGGGRDDNPGQGGGRDDNPGRGDDNPGRGDDNPGRGDPPPGRGNE